MERHSFVSAFGRNVGVATVVAFVLYLASRAANYGPVLAPDKLPTALAFAAFIGLLGAGVAFLFRAKSPLQPGWHFGAAGALAILGVLSIASLVQTVAFRPHPAVVRYLGTGLVALSLFAVSAWLSGLVVDPASDPT